MSSSGLRNGRKPLFVLRRGSAVLAGGTILALVAGFIAPVEAAPASYDGPKAQRTTKVPVAKVRSKAKPARALSRPTELPTVRWPDGGQADVSLPTAGASARSGATATSWRQAAGLPVQVTPVAQDGGVAAPSPVRGVRIRMHGRAAAQRLGLDGVVVQVDRTDGGAAGAVGVAVDSRQFAGAFGGGWSSRLRLLTVPGCALVTPNRPECRRTTVIPGSQVDASGVAQGAVAFDGRAPAATESTAARAVVVMAAGVSGSSGDYSASALNQSATWSAGTQSGSFTWSYPLRVPPSVAGPSPQLGITYDSGSVDGKSAATNNQPSWLGEGFELGSGFIERRYVSCREDMSGGNNTVKTGDLCWKTDNATLSMAGHAGELILVAGTTNTWRLKNEDGSRIERLVNAPGSPDDDGEHWKLTTGDGTQYFFGRTKRYSGDPFDSKATWTVPVAGNHSGEACHQSTFTASFCQQAWRWNLDHVVDVHGNSMSFFYERERNRYGKEAATKVADYDRGGYLREVHYGQRAGAEGSFPPARVVFTPAERCIPTADFDCAEAKLTSANAARWPDVPFDQICSLTATSCPDRGSPAFFTRKRLTKVTTSVLGGNNTFSEVDSWTFAQDFPSTPDASPKGLALNGITHTGHVGSPVTMPPVTFAYEMFRNRVEGFIDGPVMWKPRLTLVRNETGGQTSVVYDRGAAMCSKSTNAPGAPATNTKRCFPSYWTPEGAFEPTLTWFHKYVVGQVSEKDLVGDAVDTVTSYTYGNSAAWRYDNNELTPAKYRTWSDWRGFQTVETRKGSDSATTLIDRKTFLRGMHGNRNADGTPASVSVPDSRGGSTVDHDRTNGTVLERTTYNGTAVVATTINKPWISAATATAANGEKSTFTGPGVATTYLTIAGGGERVTRLTATNDGTYGTTTQLDDEGDVGTTADDRCTRTWYARNTGAWLTGTVSRQQTASVRCATTPTAAQIVSETRTLYDGLAFEVTPIRGSITETQARTDQSGAFATRARAGYDARGRITSSTDAMGRTTATAYQELAVTGQTYTGGLALVTTTDPKGYQASTAVNQAWGTPATETDANGKVTSLAYDGLGRLVSVWLPTRPRATNTTSPSMRFSYSISTTAPAFVKSEELRSTAGTPAYITSYEIFDGLLRPRQTQSPEAGTDGGRVISDVEYDSRGLAVKRNGPYYAAGAPAAGLVRVTDVQKQVSNEITYDRAGRVVRERFLAAGVEKYVTATTYGGDRVGVDPPDGQTPTTTWTDARGRTTKVWKHKGDGLDAAGGYEETTYTYFPDDKVRQIKAPGGARWDYEYDFRGRLIRADDPDKGVTTSTYDANDRVVTSTDARGKTIWTGYDELGRVTQTRENNATGPLLTARVYDTLVKGKLTSSTRYVGTDAYTSAITGYDDAYRPTGATTTIPSSEDALAGTYTSTMTYNAAGNVTQMGLPAVPGMTAETIETTYDDRLALPASISSNVSTVGSVVNGVTRSPFGEGLVVGTGVPDKAVWFGYSFEEGTRRLKGATVQRQTQGGATDVSLQYSYDKGGNVVALADTPSAAGTSAETQCYRHDTQIRLTEAWTPTNGCAADPSIGAVGGPAGYWHSYRYDASGNRTSETQHTVFGDIGRAYTTPAPTATGKGRPHGLTQVVTTPLSGAATTVAYGYDAAGNLTSRNTSGAASVSEAFNFDVEGRLASTTRNSAPTSSYVYDADGDRLIKKENGKATLYLDGTEVEFTTATGALTSTRYYQFDGKTVAVRQSGGGLRLQFADHQGSAIWSVDRATTGDTRRRRFTPFGGERHGFTPTTWPGTKGFVNGDQDAATGLTHLGAREYDPAIGRFISVDPVMNPTEPQTLNSYAYARNNPTTLSDASGLYAVWDPVSGGYTCHGPCGSPAPWEDGFSPTQDHTIHDGGSAYSQAETAANAKEDQARRQVQTAERSQAQIKRKLVRAAKQLGKILMDELGITAGLDCFTRGDLGACAETAVNVLLSAVGGFAAKIIGKYAWRWKAAARLAKSLWKLGDEIADGVKGFFKASADLKAARRQLDSVGKSCNSFDGNVRVRMADGSSKPIKRIQLGDQVLATDPVTGHTAKKRVTRLIVGSGTKKLVTVSVATKGGNRSILATDKHPFWTENDRRWTDAADLDRGDTLRAADGRTFAVADIDEFSRSQKVYNLTVAGIHTYHVLAGDTPVLVHNTGMDSCRIGEQTLGPNKPSSGISAERGDRVQPHEQRAVNEFGNEHGCSTCPATTSGYKDGHWTGDHQPPNKLAPSGPWTLYPQCRDCARQQGGIVNGLNREWYDFD